MAIDTPARRASALRMGLVIPDGAIDQADRQSVAWVYGGVLAGEAAELPETSAIGGDIRIELVVKGWPRVSNVIRGTMRIETVTEGWVDG